MIRPSGGTCTNWRGSALLSADTGWLARTEAPLGALPELFALMELAR